MNHLNIFLPAIIPVFFIILVGFICGKNLNLDSKTLSKLTVYILVPALIVDSLYRNHLSFKSATNLLLGFAIISFILWILTWSLGKILKLSIPLQKSLLAIALFPNNGNLGLPIITFALGEEGLERAIIYMIGSSILMFGFGPALLKGNNIAIAFRLTFKLPLFWALLIGLSLHLSGIKLPYKIDEGIYLLGIAAIPLALIILGIQLANTHLEVKIKEVLATTIRLLIAPLVAYSVSKILHLETLDLAVLVLQSAMPTAVNSIILVAEFGGEISFVARTVVFSTLISFLTLPLFLFWAIEIIHH